MSKKSDSKTGCFRVGADEITWNLVLPLRPVLKIEIGLVFSPLIFSSAG
jgi:hypothetical protein